MLEGEGCAKFRRRRLASGLLVIVGALIFTVGYLKSTSRWWYEDDPAQYATAAAIRSPVSIFVDPELLRGFGTGASLVPMQLLSYWVDVHLFGLSPRAAYLHSLLSTLLTVLLISLVLARLTGDPVASAFLALLWLALPSTIAVHEFLSTRHYMEGLGWSLASCCFLVRFCQPARRGRAAAGAFVWLSACAAMLSKELYVIILPAWIFGYSLSRGRRGIAAASFLLALGYAGYRVAILGTHAVYPVPPAPLRDYLRYLAVLPFTFSANRGGYVWYGFLATASVLLLRRTAGATTRLLLVSGFVVATLIPVYPTASAVLIAYKTPGTWYRAVFLVNTVVLLVGLCILVRSARCPLQVLGVGVLLVVLIPGMHVTREYWDARFTRSEEEGRFYLSNPDKLIYSEEDAAWFLPGLDRLYGISGSHYLSKYEPAGAHARTMLKAFSTLWRYRDGRWSTDGALYEAMVSQNR